MSPFQKCQGQLDNIFGARVKPSEPFSIEDETLNRSAWDKADGAAYSQSQFSGSTMWELSTAGANPQQRPHPAETSGTVVTTTTMMTRYSV